MELLGAFFPGLLVDVEADGITIGHRRTPPNAALRSTRAESSAIRKPSPAENKTPRASSGGVEFRGNQGRFARPRFEQAAGG